MDEFHVVVMNYMDTKRYPDNKPSCFRNTLALPVELDGNWHAALEELVCIGKSDPPKNVRMFVCCNLVGDSFVGNTTMPMLRSVHYDGNVDTSFIRLVYKPVLARFVNSIQVEIREEENGLFPLKDDVSVMVVLHFKRM